MALKFDHEPEPIDMQQHKGAPALREILEHLLDHSGTWFTGDGGGGGSGGARPQLATQKPAIKPKSMDKSS